MPRIAWTHFEGGWWPMGSRDDIPDGTALRFQGIAPVKSSKLKSRWGSTFLAPLDAHSVMRFAQIRFAGVGTDYWRIQPDSIIKTGLDGTKLTQAVMPPTVGITDYAFIAGGGDLFKVAPGGSVSKWGIDPPPDGFFADTAARTVTVIDTMDSTAGWTATASNIVADTSIKQEGTASIHHSIAPNTKGVMTKVIAAPGFDLESTFVPEDFIEVWFRADTPETLYNVDIAFDVKDGTFTSDFYNYPVLVSGQQTMGDQASQQVAGVGSLSQFSNGNDAAIFDVEDPQVQTAVGASAGQTYIINYHDAWTRLRIPKTIFLRNGTNTALTWSTVRGIRLSVTPRQYQQVNVYWDYLTCGGGFGLQGTYKYQVVFMNSITGSRSNPNPTEVVVPNVNREAVQLGNLPISTDAQVNRREIYRTVGNGTLKFRVGIVDDNVTTTFLDRVADFAGLDSSGANGLMSNFELQLDNNVPDQSWDDAVAPFAGSMWWGRSPNPGERGRIFYSPPGRAESGGTNFIDITGDDDPVMKLIIWNGSLWVWTFAAVYQVSGTGEPFFVRKVYGVPGTLWPFTVVVTPYGIAYLAHDGPRMFDGSGSQLIANKATALLWKNELLEGVLFVK